MSLDRKAFLRPIAHRGLHDVATGCVENTRPAFERAIAQGFGIECDVRPAADGTPVVFHDATLERLTDAAGRLDAIGADRLAGVHHRGSGQPLMLLNELLDLVRGRVPLLVEVKHDGGAIVPGFLDRTAASCAAAHGPVALMSFDADVIDRLYRLAPALPIGLVAMREPATELDTRRSRALGDRGASRLAGVPGLSRRRSAVAGCRAGPRCAASAGARMDSARARAMGARRALRGRCNLRR